MAFIFRIPLPVVVAVFALGMSYLSQRLENAPVPKDRFRAKYFANPDLRGVERVSRNEPRIDHDWAGKSPGPLLPKNHFSVLWEGRFPFESGLYRFRVAADDGVRLWVDGRLAIDEWKPQPISVFHRVIALEKGYHEVRVEYYERTGKAGIKASWRHEASPNPKDRYAVSLLENTL